MTEARLHHKVSSRSRIQVVESHEVCLPTGGARAVQAKYHIVICATGRRSRIEGILLQETYSQQCAYSRERPLQSRCGATKEPVV